MFNLEYLDCQLIFGYENGEMLDYSEIKQITEERDEQPGVTLYYIDINGFSSGEAVGRGKVISFSIYNY